MKWIVDAESIDDLVLGNYSVDMPLTECEDCKHWETPYGMCDAWEGLLHVTEKNGYCYKAKRREE